MTARGPLAVLALVLIAAVAAPSAAGAQVSARQASKKFAETYGVKVLKTRAGTIGGRRVHLLTVMNPKGDFNEAFQVTTVAVDAATGRLVPGFRHLPSGLISNQSPIYAPTASTPNR